MSDGFFFHWVGRHRACVIVAMALAGWSIFLLHSAALAGNGGRQSVAVVVSRNIRPYIQAADGFYEKLRQLSPAAIDRFVLEEERDAADQISTKKICETGYDLLVAIGPQAMSLVWNEHCDVKIKKVYLMVLNPSQLVKGEACGISLNIPVRTQLLTITRALPSLYNLGLLYDPAYNEAFANEAAKGAASIGIKIVPLPVSSRKRIPSVLAGNLRSLDGLWLIPDATVISESLVKYLIKSALYENVPVIGYNSFFYNSGAAFSFILDYEKIGEDAAKLSWKLLSGKPCEDVQPPFRTWLNLRVVRALRLPAIQDASVGIEEGP